MNKRLEGILAPVITPFRAGIEDLDVAGFIANLKAHIADGLDGVVIAGSTGEAALLSDSERAELVRAAREVVPSDKWLIAGCGAESARQTIERCRAAKAAGADAVLVVAPHYYSNAMSREALAAHYQRVADASPAPVILYNIPKYMHFALPADLVEELARHKNVIGIKDSSGDLESNRGFLRAQGDSFSFITGSGSSFLGALELGARGGILAVSLFAAALCRELLAAHRAGDAARAAAAQARLKPMADVIVARLGVPGVKGAMEQVKRAAGPPRLPLLTLDAKGRAEVAQLLG
jgi:4-hydroxy-2-oxoglutarate aldolase